MVRLSIFLALAVLLGSAIYAYGIKYDTIVLGEQIARQKIKIQKEKDQIALLKAEWQFLNRPDRIQALSDLQPDIVALQTQQIVRWSDVPMRSNQPVNASSIQSGARDDITSSTVTGLRKRNPDRKASVRSEESAGGHR